MDIKQVIVIRKDLNMRKGKMCAQSAHASMKVFFDKGEIIEEQYWFQKGLYKYLKIPLEKVQFEWITGSFKKIVVCVNSEEELINLYNQAKDECILCSLVIDNGLTEFHNVPTPTTVAIGPDYAEKIDKITGHLLLL